jgi:hypothetical protein
MSDHTVTIFQISTYYRKNKSYKRNRQHSKYQNNKLGNQSAKGIKRENDGQQGQRKSKKRAEWKPKGQDYNSSKVQTNIKQVQTVTFSSPFLHLK